MTKRAGELKSSIPARGFDPIDALIGIVVRPAVTMAEIAVAFPWRPSLVLIIGYAVLASLTNLIVPAAPFEVAHSVSGFARLYEAYASMLRSPSWIIGSVIVSPLAHAVFTAIFAGIGRLVGGRGRFVALYSTLAYAIVPSLLSIPLDA